MIASTRAKSPFSGVSAGPGVAFAGVVGLGVAFATDDVPGVELGRGVEVAIVAFGVDGKDTGLGLGVARRAVGRTGVVRGCTA